MRSGPWASRLARGKGKGQQGSALIMALIALALGSLIVPPTLRYVATGVKAAGIQNRVAREAYAADAGVEYAMWRIHSSGHGDFSETITVDGIPVNLAVGSLNTIAFGPIVSTDGTQSGRLSVTTTMDDLGNGLYQYTINVVNVETSTIHLNTIGAGVLGDFDYVTGSSSGVSSSNPAITSIGNGIKLAWPPPLGAVFSSNYGPATLQKDDSVSQSFQFSGTGTLLGYYFWVTATPNSIGLIASDSSGYNVISQAGGTTIQADVVNNQWIIFPVSWKIN